MDKKIISLILVIVILTSCLLYSVWAKDRPQYHKWTEEEYKHLVTLVDELIKGNAPLITTDRGNIPFSQYVLNELNNNK